MNAISDNHTWDFVPVPLGKLVVGYQWVFTVKVGLDSKINRFKACLVA